MSVTTTLPPHAVITGEVSQVLPAFDMGCEVRGSHGLDHLAGYDVIVTASKGAVTEVWAVISVMDPTRYAVALDAARALRSVTTTEDGRRWYAYVGQRYTCGCREVGRVARTGGVVFRGDAGIA